MAGERSGRDDDHDYPTYPPSYYGGSGWGSEAMPAAGEPPPPPPPFGAPPPPSPPFGAPPPPYGAPAGGRPGWEPGPDYPPAGGRYGADPDRRSRRAEPDRAEPGRGRSRRGKRTGLPLWQELPLLLVIAFCLAVLVRTFLVQAFYIPSGSMEDTLVAGDRVLVNKVIYNFRDPARGEVVVFRGTDAWAPVGTGDSDIGMFAKVGRTLGDLVGISRPGEKDFIKRVVGVPGDTVACCDVEGRVFVNGQPLDEGYVVRDSPLEDGSDEAGQDCRSRRFPPVVVQPGEVFVMGDHRQVSQDSRCQGQVPIDNIIGRASLIVWPHGRWDSLPAPDTFDTVPAPTALAATAAPAVSGGAAQLASGLPILVPVAGTIRANSARSRLIRRDRGRRLAE